MALDDIVFSSGDLQNIVVEIDDATYTGTLSDVVAEPGGPGQVVNVVASPPSRAEVLYVG